MQSLHPSNVSGCRTGLAFPDEVAIAMAEIAKEMLEGLLALAVGAGAGLQVMKANERPCSS